MVSNFTIPGLWPSGDFFLFIWSLCLSPQHSLEGYNNYVSASSFFFFAQCSVVLFVLAFHLPCCAQCRFELPYNIWCGGCNKHVGMGRCSYSYFFRRMWLVSLYETRHRVFCNTFDVSSVRLSWTKVSELWMKKDNRFPLGNCDMRPALYSKMVVKKTPWQCGVDSRLYNGASCTVNTRTCIPWSVQCFMLALSSEPEALCKKSHLFVHVWYIPCLPIWYAEMCITSFPVISPSGVRYNAEKRKVGNYYTTPIFRFRMKCHLCDNHFEIETDPKVWHSVHLLFWD